MRIMGNRSNLVLYIGVGIIVLVTLSLFKYNKAKKREEQETLQNLPSTLMRDIEKLSNSEDFHEKLLDPDTNYLKLLKGEE